MIEICCQMHYNSKIANTIQSRMKIYTDGSNTYNGKPYSYGGYGWVMVFEDTIIKGGGSMPVNEEVPVTNNRAELMAIIHSLQTVIDNQLFFDTININSDSQWCVQCANLKWKRIANRDLWDEYGHIIHTLRKNGVTVSVNWVRGHNGDEYNEMADQLAGEYAARLGFQSQ